MNSHLDALPDELLLQVRNLAVINSIKLTLIIDFKRAGFQAFIRPRVNVRFKRRPLVYQTHRKALQKQ